MRRALIVEDEVALRKVYVMLFSKHKYDVREAAHGKIALETLKSFEPDIIILDILMPVMGGIEFLKSADLRKNFPKTKVLVLSNLSDQKTLEEIDELGATKYLLKAGTSPSELISAVDELLS